MGEKRINYSINFNYNGDVLAFSKYLSRKNELKYIDYRINEKKISLNINVKKEKNYIYEINNKQYKSIKELLLYEKVSPKLYIDNIDIEKYLFSLAKIEEKKDKEKLFMSKIIDKKINKFLEVNNGICDVVEYNTGAIFFKDYEWYNIKNNKIKELFEIKEKGNYIYSLQVDKGIILRGEYVYYYFVADIKKGKKPNFKELKVWYKNVDIFLEKIIEILKDYKISNSYDKRLVLGIIDNLRNIILLLSNVEILMQSKDAQDLIYHENSKIVEVDRYLKLIYSYQSVINTICFTNKKIQIEQIVDLCNKIKIYSKTTLLKSKNITDSYFMGKCYNILRESDNYFENYIVCADTYKKFLKNKKEINLIGVLCGGLELPFIIKNVSNKKVNISLFFQNNGMYIDKIKKDKSKVSSNILEFGKINKNNLCYLVDDNIMSGTTIQFALNKLLVNGYNINNIIAIRHPNENRIAQIEFFDIALNLDMVDRFIIGFLMDTPYTKIKRGTNYNGEFLNELKIFSSSTDVFLKALYCNNAFKKDSEVDIFSGFANGRK